MTGDLERGLDALVAEIRQRLGRLRATPAEVEHVLGRARCGFLVGVDDVLTGRGIGLPPAEVRRRREDMSGLDAMLLRAARGDPEAALRILDSAPDTEEDDDE